MKTVSSVTSVVAALVVASLPVKASQTYNANGVSIGTSGNDGADISSVVVNNTASDITFTINTVHNQASYISFYVLLQYVGGGTSGDTTLLNSAGALNGWGPSLGISTGMNAFAATYGTGASGETYSGGVWANNASVNYDAGGTGSTYATFTLPLSSLGLSVGDSFYFDVVSSYSNPVGQGAYTALDSATGYPAQTDNSYTPYGNTTVSYDAATDAAGTSFGTAASMYTVSAVPEPAAGALLGLGALFLLIRRRTFSARQP